MAIPQSPISLSGHRPPHGPALLTADGEVAIVFEASADGKVQAKYRAFDTNFGRRRPVKGR